MLQNVTDDEWGAFTSKLKIRRTIAAQDDEKLKPLEIVVSDPDLAVEATSGADENDGI